MFFKKLEIHGFKSFPDPVTIEFHDGITCVVGPNGSGKSNVSDAIRWVLGEQSPKMLRGDKMDQVIFAGTAARKSRGMAEVVLTIDNSDDVLPIDYNEVAITRRMFRSGESEYLINNNPCRLKDIRELIMDTGIGVDGYSIIGQGKIGDIVSNKPESRREIFEESAGVVMYKSKKHEAELKLERATNNLDRVNDIISEIEGRIGNLKEDSEKAKEYLELKERYEDLEINITLRDIEKVDKDMEAMSQDVKEINEKIEKLEEERDKINESLSADKEKMTGLQELRDKANDDLINKIDEINRLTNKGQIDNERLTAIEDNLSRLEDEVKETLEKIQTEEENKKSLNENIKELDEEIKVNQEKLSEKIDNYNTCNEKAVSLTETLEKAKDELFNLRSEINNKTGELKSMESMKIALDKQKKELAEEEEKKKAEGKDVLARLDEAKKDKENCLKELEKIRSDLQKTVDKEQDLKGKLAIIRMNLEDYRIKRSQTLSRQKTIEEMEANYEGFNYAVKFIMKSNQKGIEGVVADIMNVPKEYEVAIETALGGSLQNIVCATDGDAKSAVSELKKNRAGRLTFLPLSSIKANKADDSKIKSQKGFKGMANDLIKFDSKYKNIFDYLLGRIAVVDDMDNAIALSKKSTGIRIVTLEGEIINTSGAITGGKFKNKTAGILSRKGEIADLQKKIEDFDKNIKNELAEEEKLGKESKKLLSQRDDFTIKKNELEIKFATSEHTYDSLKQIAEENDLGQNEFKNRLSNIDGDYKNIDQEIERLNKEIEEAKEKIAETNASIGTKTAEEASAKIRANEASESITKARIEETELVHKKESVQTIIDRIDEQIKDLNGQIEVKEFQKSKFEDEKSQILYGSDDAVEKVEAMKKEKEDLEGYIEKVKGEIEELEKSTGDQGDQTMDMVSQLNSLNDQKYNVEIKMGKRETQGESYKEKLWDEFEMSYAEAMDHRKEDFAVSRAKKDVSEIRNRIRELGDVNVGAIKEYETVGQRYEHLTTQREDIQTAMAELDEIINDMEKIIKKQFKENFDKIVVNFEEIFKELFGGGHAELRLEGSDNPLDAGIEIVAQPPGKKLQNINLMSGGEKTMTAIALMFAVLKTKPTPFCILDEVEAALDDANIDRFADYLKKFKEIQFTLITHQKATMEHADVLYGVTMPERGISKVLSLKLEDDFDLE